MDAGLKTRADEPRYRIVDFAAVLNKDRIKTPPDAL
jgi:hypothetical protein